MTSDTALPPAPGAQAPAPTTETQRRWARQHSIGTLWETWGITAVLVVLLAASPLLSSDFLTVANLQSVLRESAYLGIVAAAMTLAVMNGTFDLSVGGQLALVSVTTLMGYAAGGTGLAALVAVLTGMVCGAVNGALVTAMRVPPFVATLGMLFVFRGVAYVLTQDGPKTLPYSEIGSPFVKIGGLNIAGIPLPFLIMLACYGAVWVLLRRTATGRRIVAFGSSPEAARFCGISVHRIRMLIFVVIGVSVGIAALTYISRVWTADGSAQDGFELRVIAAVVLGGTSLKGGKGTLIGTFSAVLLVGVLNDLLVSRGVDASYQRVVLGCVLITALAIDGLRTRFAAAGSFARMLPRRRREAPAP
ncbi:ABC transporter permease [Micromonospora sp. 4G57]|uniref:ABC transporter permease n=1 Tax=Micromonospora sicca TaxID=2202420 RepID=A0ABU5JBL7_9ACTN|nr:MULTISPECIES: ABC transporter permease [unclassified Micromonospora]MDZ5441553.1 ABC transporter permease [Micromonospora sp. 4G57]MDZ5489950.1 ABC transporter permease [Micromonospora sp. 4G53]